MKIHYLMEMLIDIEHQSKNWRKYRKNVGEESKRQGSFEL